jgi:ParB family chromosome partitioning protein
MKIEIHKIRPSPNPIRKSWDEDKLRDLSWSLLEEGQVEPIGVYEDPGGYTVVWGHRRVEAARRAGWGEIDALVVAQDAINNLIQSGIENLSSEEMSADDKAAWAQRLVDMGFTQHEIARRTSIPAVTINQWLQYRREKEAGVFVHVQNPLKDEGIIKTIKIAQALGDDLEAKKAVAAKVSAEGLTQLQTTEIARAYHDAPSPEVRSKILETPVRSSDTSADILRRSMAKLEFDKIRIPKSRSGVGARDQLYTDQDFAKALKEFVDALQSFRRAGNKMVRLTRYGTFSKAAVRYGIRRIDELMGELKTYKEFLEGAK